MRQLQLPERLTGPKDGGATGLYQRHGQLKVLRKQPHSHLQDHKPEGAASQCLVDCGVDAAAALGSAAAASEAVARVEEADRKHKRPLEASKLLDGAKEEA